VACPKGVYADDKEEHQEEKGTTDLDLHSNYAMVEDYPRESIPSPQGMSHQTSSPPSTPSSSLPATWNTSSEPPPKKRQKLSQGERKQTEIGTVDMVLIEGLKQAQSVTHQEDESTLFGRQIAATIRRLSHHQQAVAKLRIQQVLLDVEFGDTITVHDGLT
jgi:hypothetical protein